MNKMYKPLSSECLMCKVGIPKTSTLETFTYEQVLSALKAFIDHGEESIGKSHCGYFSGGGYAARAMRYFYKQLSDATVISTTPTTVGDKQ